MECRIEPSLIEEAVFLALSAREDSGDALARAFRAEWDAVYGAQDHQDAREQHFHQVAQRYFDALGLTVLVTRCFEEVPLVRQQVRLAVVRRVWSRKEEQVELYVDQAADAAQPAVTTLLLGLQAVRCLHPEALTAYLRHELLQISDMLDPAFAYAPHPVLGGTSETEDELIRGRFRLLWHLWVDGRMQQRGWPSPVQAAVRRREFGRAFGRWAPARQEQVWQDLWTRTACTQRELLELARDAHLTTLLGDGGVRCPLCHFPTSDGLRDGAGALTAVAEAIRADYPAWEPAHGACRQCIELYQAHAQALR